MALADLLNAFRTAKPVEGQAPGAVNPQQPSAQNNTTVPNSTNTPAGGQNNGLANPTAFGSVPSDPAKSPMEKFEKLWDVDPQAKAPTSLTPNLNIDPAKLLEMAKGVDFTKSISPDLLAKTRSSNADEAQSALLQVINQVGQFSYAQAIDSNSRVTEAAIKKHAETLVQEHLPRMLREAAVQGGRGENPIYSDPTFAPIVASIEQQVTSKFPTATPAEIKEHMGVILDSMAQKLVGAKGGTINIPDPAQTRRRQKTEVDWDKYFSDAS